MPAKRKRASKKTLRESPHFPIMNVAAWFLPVIADSQRLMIKLTEPLAGQTSRKAKCNAFDSYDKHPKPRSLTMAEAASYFRRESAHRQYYVESSEFGITLSPSDENAGAKSPATADLRFDVSFLERITNRDFSAMDYLESVFQAFDADGNCFFALANADTADENRWGTLYSIFPKQRMSCQKHIDYFRWYDILNGPQDQIRGIYWGTFIGPKLAKRLPRSIVDDFNALADPYAGSPQRAAWLPKGSVYFLLNDDPRVNYDESIEPPTGLENMYTNCGVWLARQLHAAGIY